MKIIIGLGNPGKEYAASRHNVGFLMLDKLKGAWNFPEFKNEKKFKAKISAGEIAGEKIILAKPETFMNLSGESVSALLDFYKLEPKDIVVIHDELDIELEKYKISSNSRSAGHNGVQNIIDRLKTQEFCRLRIGIKEKDAPKNTCKIGAHDYVLGKFSEKELELLEKISEEIIKKIEETVSN